MRFAIERRVDDAMSDFGPVAIFAFRRPDHLRRCVESLQRCPEFTDSRIFLFADGARDDGDRTAVADTRRVARDLLGAHADYRFSDRNRGLAASIIDGVSELVDRFGRVIVVEDDLEVAPVFLAYQNEALTRYSVDERVLQVCGYMFDVAEFRQRTSALFLPLTTTWGWGTWKRAWRHFDASASGWDRLRTDRGLRHRFNLDGTYDYAGLLDAQMAGRASSWGIRWYWSVFQRDGLVVYPPRSLVRNTGFDGTGTHGRGALRRFGGIATVEAIAPTLPPTPAVEDADMAAVRRAVWRQNGGWLGYGIDRLRRIHAAARRVAT
jgi:hypothetical protein